MNIQEWVFPSKYNMKKTEDNIQQIITNIQELKKQIDCNYKILQSIYHQQLQQAKHNNSLHSLLKKKLCYYINPLQQIIVNQTDEVMKYSNK